MKSIALSRLLLPLSLALVISGCGKYGPPIAPEQLAPKVVKAFAVQASDEGVTLRWEAPATDRRGKELKSMTGYQVLRSIGPTIDPVTNEVAEFETIKFIEDTHIAELERLKEQARVEGKLTRRVKIDPALKSFSYLDTELTRGGEYRYQITPVNQGDVDGVSTPIATVTFNGAESIVSIGEELADPLAFTEESSLAETSY